MTLRNRWTWFVEHSRCSSAGLALLAAACGGGGKKSTVDGTTGTHDGGGGGTRGQKTFPNFRVVYDTGTDYLDPGLSYTVQGWEAMWNVYLEPARVQARRTAPTARRSCRRSRRTCRQVSVGRQDVHADAALGPQVLGRHAGQGERLQVRDQAPVPRSTRRASASSRTSSAPTSSRRRRRATSPGSRRTTRRGEDHDQADRSRRATSRTSSRRSFAAPVPPGTPAKDQSTHPIPSTGPYMIQSYQPNRQFVLVRNPNFKPTDGRPGDEPGQDDLQDRRGRLGGAAAGDQRPGRLRLPPDPGRPARRACSRSTATS